MSLEGKRVAILTENYYQELEFWYPLLRLREEGAEVTIATVSPTTCRPSAVPLSPP